MGNLESAPLRHRRPERAWVGVLIRDGRPQPISGSVVLVPGDRVHVYCQPEDAAALERIFAGSSG